MDECIATEPECDEELVGSEEICASLTLQAKRVGELFTECETHYKAFHKRVVADIDPIEDAELIPKDKMKVWLQAHNLSERVTFQQFFEAFLQDHKKEGRLDLSNRSLDPNPEARALLGIKRAQKKIPVLDLIELLTNLFE